MSKMRDRIAGGMMVKRWKRILSVILCAALLFADGLPVLMPVFMPIAAHAAVDVPIPNPLSGLNVSPADIVFDNQRGQSTTAMNHTKPPDLNNAELISSLVDGSASYSGRTVRYHLDEYNKGYRSKPAIRTVTDRRSGLEWTGPAFIISQLPSGTIFDIDATVFTQYTEFNGTGAAAPGNSPESQLTGSPVRIYTGTKLDGVAVAPDQVQLTWDDVWFNNQRIYAYDLNIYTGNTATVPEATIRFTQSQIGAGQPLSVNQSSGKLEYTHTVPYAGRVYCFEVVPVMSNVPDVIMPAKHARVSVATTILVSATKLYEVDNIITWELKWSNVTAGMGAVSANRYTAEYSLNKLGGGASFTRLQVINNETSTILETPKDPNHPDNLNALYEITAKVFENGRELYAGEGITISSGSFALKEGEIPYQPQAPVLKLMPNQKFENSAEIWWNIPKEVTQPESDDENVIYEIFVLDDPQQLYRLTETPVYTADGRTLRKGSYEETNGYLYQIPNLKANTTYYLAVRAIKSFVDITTMTNKRYTSELSYVIVTTAPVLPGGQPPAPITFDIFEDEIKYDAMRFFAQSVWYENFDRELGEWVVCEKKFDADGAELPDHDEYRKMSFVIGDRINLYYTTYRADMNLDDPDSFGGFGTISAPMAYIDEKIPTSIAVTTLVPNTTYVFWIKAERGRVLSEPSKVIVATTPPVPNTEIETPTVPEFNIVFIGDTYVDLLWIRKPDYRYSIQISRGVDFPGNSGNITTRMTSTKEINDSGMGFYRLSGLNPDTLYYFRVQAEATSPVSGAVKRSGWSDSKPARTKPPMPPETPSGFGIKMVGDAITKDSIFYEWMRMPGLAYVFEFSEDSTIQTDATERGLGAVSEYNLTGLLSNHRYYARLYALDPVTGLRSKPTYIIGVRTLRSDDDYDANADTTLRLSGEFVVKDLYAVEGVWTVRVAGTDADRFAERLLTDTMLDYVIDLSAPPKYTETIRLIVDGKVFESLDKMLENMELQLKDKSFVVRPNTLAAGLAGTKAGRLIRPQYEILLSIGGDEDYVKPQGYRLKTEATGFAVNVLDGNDQLPIARFKKGVRVVVPFTSANWYQDGVTNGIVLDESGKWQTMATAASFNPDTRKGTIVFEYAKPGNFGAADFMTRGLFTDVSGKYSEHIQKLGAKGYTDVAVGGYYRPGDEILPEEAVEMLFRAMEVPYSEDYMNSAVKGGYVGSVEDVSVTMEAALAMVVRAYEVKTGNRAAAGPGGDASEELAADSDIMLYWTPGVESVESALRVRVQFALDNGITAPVLGTAVSRFSAGRPVTRGEMAVFICMMLEML